MRLGRRSWWIAYAAGSLVIITALAWVTAVVVQLERAELQVRSDAAQQDAVRLALWRMDSWLGPRIALESVRPYFEYFSYYPQERAFTRFFNRIDPEDVLTASPLLTYRNNLILIHFHIDDMGTVTSPEVPTGDQRQLALSTVVQEEELQGREKRLNDATAMLARPTLIQLVQQAAPGPAEMQTLLNNVATQYASADKDAQQQFDNNDVVQSNLFNGQQGIQQQAEQQQAKTQQEKSRRSEQFQYAQNLNAPPSQTLKMQDEAQQPAAAAKESEVEIGPLVPIWLNTSAAAKGDASTLVFARTVKVAGKLCVQGFLVNWEELQRELLGQVKDLLQQPALRPILNVAGAAGDPGQALASVPVTLEIPPAPVPKVEWFTPARVTLGLTWMAVLAALGAAAVTLRSSIAFGLKRSRFASSVTHELRTPLTTFRMYSEMLAAGMVPSAEQRQVYLNTLKDESQRLANIVENVLAYARLEDGRAPSHAVLMTLKELLERVKPSLQRRVDEAGMMLEMDIQSREDRPFLIDADAVSQVLFNLVDNACKYAQKAEDRRIHLIASADQRDVRLTVRDHGPGVDARHARAIFAPFDRGTFGPSDSIPGVGLGLALCRSLAQELGGKLVLDSPNEKGASFTLMIKRHL